MIKKQYSSYVFSFFMALLMSGIMSFAISVFNLGLPANILVLWLKAWAMAFVIALPAIIMVTPLVRKLVSMVIED